MRRRIKISCVASSDTPAVQKVWLQRMANLWGVTPEEAKELLKGYNSRKKQVPISTPKGQHPKGYRVHLTMWGSTRTTYVEYAEFVGIVQSLTGLNYTYEEVW